MNSRLPHIAVLGGGYAGMAAAVTLAQAGVAVTVYEAASHLGGRARRVDYKGVTLDNGLHVLIGACSEVQKLVQLVNRDAARMLLRLPLDWHMVEGFRLRVRPLPAPFHLAVALATAQGLGWRARWAAARFIGTLRAARFRLTDDVTVAALLAAHRQHESAIRYLWQPLCASALNTPIDAASARVFVNVLRDGLAKAAAQHRLPVRSIDKPMRATLRKNKAATNDHFIGDAAAGGAAYWTLERLEKALEGLPKSGVVELMCHPGADDMRPYLAAS